MSREINSGPRATIKSLPKAPGVYLFKDSEGRVIYVGKASNLRSRVSSYFHSKTQDLKSAALVVAINGIEHIETDSEIEALLLESKLIKDYRPRYNSDLKDDKSYPLIAISRESFPRVTITRDRTRDSQYIGPFVGAKELKQAMPILQRIFKFRTCSFYIDPDRRKRRRPCLLYYIERCSAPCAGRVSKTEYATQIRHLKQFIKGKKKSLLVNLTRQMKEASRKLDFERAAQLRDEIEAVRQVHQLAKVESLHEDLLHPDLTEGLKLLKKELKLAYVPRLVEGIDAAQISGKEAVGSAVVFVDGEPHKASYRHYRIKTARTVDDPAMIAEVVRRRYRAKVRDTAAMPHILLVDGGPTQLGSTVSALSDVGAREEIGRVISLAKREETVFLPDGKQLVMKRTSPALKILQHVRDEAHRFAQRYHHILRRKKVLGR